MILGRSLRDPRGFAQEAFQLCKTTPEVIPLAPRREVNLFLIQRFMKSATKVPRAGVRGPGGGGAGGRQISIELRIRLIFIIYYDFIFIISPDIIIIFPIDIAV